MPREKPAFRDNLDRLDEAFPDRELLSVTEVARYLGKSSQTVAKRFPFRRGLGISKATLARELS